VRFGRGNFPKALRASADGLVSVGLWPAENGIGHTIAHASHRTFEVLFDFHAKDAADPAGAMYRFQYHLVGRTSVPWYNRCTGDTEIYPLYHMVSRSEEEALAKAGGWKNNQADRKRGLSVWRSWYWGLGGFHNQHDFGRIGLVNFLRDDDIERAGGYFLFAENRLSYNADWSCEHGAGITDFGRNNYIGRKINFEEEHRQWYGIPLLYYTNGDQRIGDVAFEYANKMRADCSSPRMYGYERFLGWANYLLGAGYDMTGDDRFREGLRTHLKTILSGAKWPVDWNRGPVGTPGEWAGVAPEPNVNLHTPGLMNGYITHDGLWNGRMQFGWDDPAGERLADIVEGLEWFMAREAYVEEGGIVYVPSEFSLTNHPAKSAPSYKLPFESYYSILLPILANGEEYTPGLLEKAVKSGQFRLPTEAEWEWAGRAGARTRFCFGDAGEILPDYAWINGNTKSTRPVGTKKPNAWGLHDMHGNVLEWCGDRYSKDFLWAGSSRDPVGPATGSKRVWRGSSWRCYEPWNCRVAHRWGIAPTEVYDDLGLRLAASVGP
jgi:hypothetical protein